MGDAVRQLLPYLALAVASFLVSTALGYSFRPLLEGLVEPLRGILREGVEPWQLFLFIFTNNALKLFFALALSFLFGLIPLMMLLVNGLLIGAVVGEAMRSEGPLFILAALLPHGWIEIPVFLFTMALGLRIGYLALLSLRGRSGYRLWGELGLALGLYVRRALPLLLLAALLEAFLTPRVVELVQQQA